MWTKRFILKKCFAQHFLRICNIIHSCISDRSTSECDIPLFQCILLLRSQCAHVDCLELHFPNSWMQLVANFPRQMFHCYWFDDQMSKIRFHLALFEKKQLNFDYFNNCQMISIYLLASFIAFTTLSFSSFDKMFTNCIPCDWHCLIASAQLT